MSSSRMPLRIWRKEILELFADPDRAATIGAAARQFVEQNWTWEAHFLRLEAEMLDAIDELADQNKN